MQIKIGTRKSKLALIQTQLIIDQINIHCPEIECLVVPMITTGDMIKDIPLYEIGGKALFLKEIEKALLKGEIDLAVHSLKDVPGKMPLGLRIAACIKREDPRDALVSSKYRSIEELPGNASVGTCSPRRKIFLQQIRPDLQILPMRGNMDSRWQKLMNGEFDAGILALAGLQRLKLYDEQYCTTLSIEQMLPCVGQGVIAVEIKEHDTKMQKICDQINHQDTWQEIIPERVFLEQIDATCKTPLAAHTTRIDQENIRVDFMLADFDGNEVAQHHEIGRIEQGAEIGLRGAELMLAKTKY